jgi:hypothetical protein
MTAASRLHFASYKNISKNINLMLASAAACLFEE